MTANLNIGDRIPYRLTPEGHPTWIIVSEVVEPGLYVVQYPDGTYGPLTDTE